MTRATTLTLATLALAILGAFYAPADPAELELGAQQLEEAQRLEREQREEEAREALVERHRRAGE